jgi:sodium/bile acid cotransporter 7
VWTRRAGGNDAVAFLVTIITNLSCFLVVPAWLWLLVGAESRDKIAQADISYTQIVIGLVLLVVLPIVAAQALRQSKAVGTWASRHKHQLSHLAQCGVLLIVFVGAVDCGMQLESVNGDAVVSPANLGMMILAVAAVHVTLLTLGYRVAHGLKFSHADAIAVAFSGSQKTLMVGAYLAFAIGPLAILPMVAYHAAQLLIDTLIADWFRRGASGPARHQEQDLNSSGPV